MSQSLSIGKQAFKFLMGGHLKKNILAHRARRKSMPPPDVAMCLMTVRGVMILGSHQVIFCTTLNVPVLTQHQLQGPNTRSRHGKQECRRGCGVVDYFIHHLLASFCMGQLPV
jgi:hypothetical protein